MDLGDEYWAMRDGIVQAELLITRMLKFDMNVEHPHKVSRMLFVVLGSLKFLSFIMYSLTFAYFSTLTLDQSSPKHNNF